jgi:amphi-Trp domain-containing protein
MREIDVEREYTTKETAQKLRRIADALENGESFRLQVDGKRVSVPANAKVEIELQLDDESGEIEIEISWTRKNI